MKTDIVYSQYDSRTLTELYDSLLAFRDEFCFATLLKGCRKGYLEGAEYGDKKKWRGRLILHAIAWIFPVWATAFFLKMIYYPASPAGLIRDAVWIAAVCVILCWILYSPRALPLYKAGGWSHGKEARCQRPPWEDRKDCPYHILYKPVLYGFSLRRAKRRLKRAELAGADLEARQLIKQLYECAYDLSVLRHICTVSEEVKHFTELCGEENVEIGVTEDRRVTYLQPEEMYKLKLTGRMPVEQDSVIPVEAEPRSETIALPFEAGQEMVRRFRRKRRLDLSALDDMYRDLRREVGNCKKAVRSYMEQYKAEADPAVTDAMERVRF